MTDPREDAVHGHFQRSREVLERAAGDRELVAAVLAIADRLTVTLRAGGKLLLAGNGGSAADAQHIAGEFLSRFKFDRNPLPAIALTTDTSVLTAIGNDYGFEHVFARQVSGLGQKGRRLSGDLDVGTLAQRARRIAGRARRPGSRRSASPVRAAARCGRSATWSSPRRPTRRR